MCMITVFILVGCGNSTSSSTDTVTSTQNELDNINDDNQDEATKKIVIETKPSNWFIRLVAEDPARALKSSSSQLGALEESDAVQNHTLKALSPGDSTYLDVIFVDPDGVSLGDYKTNFHVYQEETEESWQFTVKTDDNNTEILLTWNGLYVLTPYTDSQDRTRYKEYRSLTNPLIKQMKLIDMANGKEIIAVEDGKTAIYAFNMDGQNERTFRWVVQTEVVDLPLQTNKLSALEAITMKKDATAATQKIIRKKAEMFDLSKPPKIK